MTGPTKGLRRNWPAWLAPATIVVLAIGLRVVALRSDPYPRLDWSAGLLTDEGFYIHNARNVALFGQARTDEFNNMLLAPVLHAVQVVVFRAAGVGSVQARMISVAFSLAAVLLLWDALRRLYGTRTAWIGAAFLGLDHTNLLFSRMALMDPFAAFGAVLAFRLFVAGRQAAGRRALACFMLAGLALGATILNRSICIYLAPVPFFAAAWGRADRVVHFALVAGLVAALAIWLVVWWAPNRTEITRVSRYYRTEQVQPRSALHLWSCLRQGAFGDHRGISPYLFRHTPVAFALALAFLASGALAGRSCPPDGGSSARRAGDAYLTAWLGCGWLALSASAYSPSRYYVTTYPALAGVAALAMHRLPDIVRRLASDRPAARGLRGAVVAFVAYHAAQSLVHRGGVIGPWPTSLALNALPLVAGCAAAWWRPDAARLWPALSAAIPILWMAANGWWLTDWLRTMRFSQHEASTALGRMLAPDSVLIGDVAPGLCLDNTLRAVNVIPGLCNGERPVERQSGRPRFIAILDGRWKERYWLEHYPLLVGEDRRILLRRVLRWDIGVYRAFDAKPEMSSI
jgi:4-amino-4-deoxy-L-arabinose transferase-like glycosyltransferase